jgi:pyruvate/2-oxoglutarate dehydrogenase complex dihydrolipoamide dehydrogenase (E3) component
VVTYKKEEEILEDVYDTVLFAIGRSADTQGLGLQEIGVKTAKTGKIICK